MNTRIEKFLLWAAVAYMLGYALSFGTQAWLPYLSLEKGYSPKMISITNSLARLFGALPISVVCGLWLRSAAREERRSPTTWFFFGFIFTVVGVALFYATAIYSRLRLQNSNQSQRANEHS